MPKVLAQAGTSLADVYDIEGSIAGVDQLISEEVHLQHEMGGAIFSERFNGHIQRLATGALVQNTDFDVISTELPDAVGRILGITVVAAPIARTGRAMVAIRDPGPGRELPLFVWDIANDVESQISIVEDGGASGLQAALISNPLMIPNFSFGAEQPDVMNELAFRGRTTAFGAGTVSLVALVYIGFGAIAGISSHGLPIPSW